MRNTVTFMLYNYKHCVRNVTHSVTTLLHDKYFTVFQFKIFLAEKDTFSDNNVRNTGTTTDFQCLGQYILALK